MDEMLSVTEYANLTGKDPGNIRRMLSEGRLDGIKVGNQWVIPSDAVYPIDKRKKTGKYRNWRKRVELNANKDIMPGIHRLIKEFSVIYGDLLIEIILYGSYARGEQTDESDIDIALLLKDLPSKDMTDKMINCTVAEELEIGKVLSVIDIQKDKYEHWKKALPFYKNIDKEGIVLWKEA